MRTSLGIFLFCVWANMVHAKDVDCLFEVRGASYLDGVCNGEFSRDGSFTLGLGGERSRYIVSVKRNSDGRATAHWNGTPGSNSADHPLGSLSRSGACWIGEQTKVCAWKIGEDRWFADSEQTSPAPQDFSARSEMLGDELPTQPVRSDPSECAGYLGQTVETTTVVEALAPLRSLSGKSEFETTASFQSRLRSQVTGKLDRTLIIGKDPQDRKYFEYDADNRLLRITKWAFDNETFMFDSAFRHGSALAATQIQVDFANNIGVVTSRSAQVAGGYVATNGFGATVDVVRYQWTTTAIFDRPGANYTDLFPGADKQYRVVGQLRLDPVEAQRIKSGLKVGFVVSPKPPYMVSGSHRPHSPTRDSPQDITENYLVLVANIQCGLLINSDNKVLGAYPAR